jgi:hypothetical protein
MYVQRQLGHASITTTERCYAHLESTFLKGAAADSRTRSKNEIQAVLQRRLQGRPPCSDLFGLKGREWLASLELPCE